MAKVNTELDFNLVDNVTRGLKKIENGINGLLGNVVKVNQAAELTGKVFDALGKVGSVFDGAIDSAEAFGAAMAEVRAVTGASEAEFERLKAAAENAVGNFDATQAAKGLAELARSGFDANQSIAALTPTLNLALGQQLEVGRAAELTAQTLKQFQLEASEAARVADVLAKAADSTAAGVEDTALALTYAAPLAKQLGLSLEETTAAIGALSNAGFKGEKAGTALRNVFSQLIDPSTAFARAVKAAGIESTDLAEILDGLTKTADGGKSAFLALDAAATPAILALAQQGGAALNKLEDDFNAAKGAAQATADIFGEEFGAKVNVLVNRLDQARRALAAPILTAITDDVGRLSDRLDELIQSEQFRKLTVQVAQFADEAAAEFVKFFEAFDFEDAAEKSSQFVRATAEDFRVIVGETRKTIESIKQFKDELTALYKVADSLSPSSIFRFAESLTDAATAAVGLGQSTADVGQDVRDLGEEADATAIKLDKIASPDRSAGFGIAGKKLREYRQRLNELRLEAQALRDAGDLNAALEVDVQIDQQIAKIADLRTNLAALAESQRKVKAAADETKPSLNQLQEALTAAFKAGNAAEVARLTREINQLHAAQGQAAESARLLNTDLNGLKAAIAQAITEGDLAKARALGEEYRRAADAQAALTEQVARYTGENEKAAKSQQQSAKRTATDVQRVADAHKNVADQSDQAGQAQEQSAAKAGTAVQQLAARINALRAEFAAFGDEASGEFEARLERINFGFRGLGTSMINYVTALENAAGRVRLLIAEQESAVDNLESGLSAATVGLGTFGRSAEETLLQLQRLEASTYDTNGQFRLLSQQRLDSLRRQIAETTAAVQDQANALAELNRIAVAGNDRKAEEQRYQQELQRIEELAARAGSQNAAVAAEARRAAEREHRRRLNEIAERAAAERRSYADADQADAENVARARARREEGDQAPTQTTATGARPGREAAPSEPPTTINITFNSTLVDKQKVVDDLIPEIDRALRRRDSLRIGPR